MAFSLFSRPQKKKIEYRLNSDIFGRKMATEEADLMRISQYLKSHNHTAFILNNGNLVQEILVRELTMNVAKRTLHISLDDGGHDRHFNSINIVNDDNVTVCCLYYVFEEYMKNYGTFEIEVKF